MDCILTEEEPINYLDYVDIYGDSLKEEKDYLNAHIKRLYEKQLVTPNECYVEAIRMLFPMVDGFIETYLNDRYRHADRREKLLINMFKAKAEFKNSINTRAFEMIKKIENATKSCDTI